MACQCLESCGYSIQHTGTVVSVAEPWLSASPDGVISSNELLEIKCPLLGRSRESLEDLFTSKGFDVKMVDRVSWATGVAYYMQVQLGTFLHRPEGMQAAHLVSLPTTVASRAI